MRRQEPDANVVADALLTVGGREGVGQAGQPLALQRVDFRRRQPVRQIGTRCRLPGLPRIASEAPPQTDEACRPRRLGPRRWRATSTSNSVTGTLRTAN